MLDTPDLQPQPVLTDGGEVRASGNEAHLDARSRQLDAEIAANCARTEDAHARSILCHSSIRAPSGHSRRTKRGSAAVRDPKALLTLSDIPNTLRQKAK